MKGKDATQRFSALQHRLLCAALHFFHRHIRSDGDVLTRMEGNALFRLFYEVQYHQKADLDPVFPASVYDASPLHVCSFVLSFLHQGIFSVSAFIVSVIYLSRFKEASHITLHACTWRPLFVSALLVADKMWEDKPVRNSSVSKLFPVLSNLELNKMENRFLLGIKFNVIVKPELFCSFCEKLLAENVHPEITACVSQSEYATMLVADTPAQAGQALPLKEEQATNGVSPARPSGSQRPQTMLSPNAVVGTVPARAQGWSTPQPQSLGARLSPGGKPGVQRLSGPQVSVRGRSSQGVVRQQPGVSPVRQDPQQQVRAQSAGPLAPRRGQQVAVRPTTQPRATSVTVRSAEREARTSPKPEPSRAQPNPYGAQSQRSPTHAYGATHTPHRAPSHDVAAGSAQQRDPRITRSNSPLHYVPQPRTPSTGGQVSSAHSGLQPAPGHVPRVLGVGSTPSTYAPGGYTPGGSGQRIPSHSAVGGQSQFGQVGAYQPSGVQGHVPPSGAVRGASPVVGHYQPMSPHIRTPSPHLSSQQGAVRTSVGQQAPYSVTTRGRSPGPQLVGGHVGMGYQPNGATRVLTPQKGLRVRP